MTRCILSEHGAKVLVFAVLVTLVAGSVGACLAQEIPSAKLPLLIVSAGQSTGIYVANALADKIKLPYDWADVPTEKEIAAGVGLGGMKPGPGVHVESHQQGKYAGGAPYKTVILVMGASLKGMGASGLDVAGEVARLKKIINYCKSKGILLIGMHVEGKSGRGRKGSEQEEIIDAVAPYVDYLMVMSASNFDDRFTNIAKENGIPLSVAKNTTEMADLMAQVFGIKR